MTFFISRKLHSIGEVLKRIFFRNPRIAKVVAVERDVKPCNMNFAKVDRRGGVTCRGGVYTDKYSISKCLKTLQYELCKGRQEGRRDL